MPSEPRTIRGPCFDCDDSLDDAWELCPCRSRSGYTTEPTPKLDRRNAAQRAAEDDVMTRDELVRELERLYAATENPALFAGSLISYAAHVVKSCGGTCDMWMHATKGAFETAIKTWEKHKLPTFDVLGASNGSTN